MSKHLNATQLRGLNKLGDYMLPGFGELGSFSQVNAAANVDRVFDYMSAKDLADLKMLLSILAFLPRFVIAAFVGFLELTQNWPGPLGSGLRFVRIGLRGLVMTLYYSNSSVTDRIGYRVGVYTGDLADQ